MNLCDMKHQMCFSHSMKKYLKINLTLKKSCPTFREYYSSYYYFIPYVLKFQKKTINLFFKYFLTKLMRLQLTENKCINKISVNYLQKIEL